jgi:hypothetical protein
MFRRRRVAKVKPQADPPKRSAAKKPAATEASNESTEGLHPLARRRALVGVALAVVAALGLGGSAVWRLVSPMIAGGQRYVLQADGITISDPPEWIVGDVRRQVIETSGLAGRLSILDPNFVTTIEHAFALHPWVDKVERIEKRYPPAVHVEIAYRRPVAVVEVPQGEAALLLPVDAHGIHLPADDVPLIRRTYLPRITGIVGQPPVGRPWDDPRVAGAVELAVRLADVWEALNLTSIVPSALVKVQGEHSYFAYDLVNRGGTRIAWGPAPQAAPPGEDNFSAKLARLKQCVSQYSAVEWVDWPEMINIRNSHIEITPREAKKRPAGGADPIVAKKPEKAADDAVVK